MLDTQKQNPFGLHRRYFIQKVDSENRLKLTDPGSEYFVLRLDEHGSDREHIKACRIAAHAYADAIQAHLPALAKDIKRIYPLLSK